MSQSLALLEFGSVAVGMLAVDRMLKNSPVALLRCGTVHPGRYLALVGGSVASTQEAHSEGVLVGREAGSLVAEVCLADPVASLAEALAQGQGDMDGAVQVLDLGVEMDPEDVTTHIMKSKVLIFKGDKDGAIASAKKALELDPESEQAREILAQFDK